MLPVSGSINKFSPMTHTTLKMEGSSTPIHASTVSDQPMSTAITTIETTTGSTAGNAPTLLILVNEH
jgi:hypothetical protein